MRQKLFFPSWSAPVARACYCLCIALILASCQLDSDQQSASDSPVKQPVKQELTTLEFATRVLDKRQLTDFALLNQQATAVGRTALEGQWSLVFFGFTRCPDICPPTLTQLSAIQKSLLERSADHQGYPLQTVFISVDPEHDTPAVVAQYLKSFDSHAADSRPLMQGLTGDERQIRALAVQLGVAYEGPDQHAHHIHGSEQKDAMPTQTTENQQDSQVVHSGAVLLLDPKAYVHAIFPPPLPAAKAMREDIQQLLTETIGLRSNAHSNDS